MSDSVKMTKEQFVIYVFDKSVELYGALHSGSELDLSSTDRDKFDKIYRFIANRLRDRLDEQHINVGSIRIPEL